MLSLTFTTPMEISGYKSGLMTLILIYQRVVLFEPITVVEIIQVGCRSELERGQRSP